MDDATKARSPRRLVDWPWVTVEVECSLCPRRGRYRLARLAERLGAERDLRELLLIVSAKCTIPKFDEPARKYEARCGVRYRVPAGGPRPEGVPAREVRPDAPPFQPRRRREPAGPLPTVGGVLAEGCPVVLVYCTGRRHDGYLCHHQGRVNLLALGLPPDLPFIHIPRARRLRCSRCGSRQVEVRSERPDPRQVRAASMGVDIRPALAGTVAGFRMLGSGEPPAA